MNKCIHFLRCPYGFQATKIILFHLCNKHFWVLSIYRAQYRHLGNDNSKKKKQSVPVSWVYSSLACMGAGHNIQMCFFRLCWGSGSSPEFEQCSGLPIAVSLFSGCQAGFIILRRGAPENLMFIVPTVWEAGLWWGSCWGPGETWDSFLICFNLWSLVIP